MYYTNLPIFKSALDLVVYVEEMVKGFDRYHKYSIGAELRVQSKSILFGIAKANMTKECAKIYCAIIPPILWYIAYGCKHSSCDIFARGAKEDD